MHGSNDKVKTTFSGHSNFNPAKHKPYQGGTTPSFKLVGLGLPDEFIKRFKVMFKDGRSMSVSYALLPVIIYHPDLGIEIRTSEFTIRISGRGLLQLEEYLSAEQVSWIKESPSGADTQEEGIFILSITVRGEIRM